MKSQTSMKVFRFLAWFVSIYHVLLGVAATFGNTDFVISVASRVYNITLNVDPTVFITFARFVGSYMIAFGLMMALVALKPYEYRHMAWVAVALFGLRIFDRLVFFSVLQQAFHVTVSDNLMTVVPIGLIALGLIIFRPKASQS